MNADVQRVTAGETAPEDRMPTDRTNAQRQARRRAQFTAMRDALRRIALEAATVKEARAIALEALEDRG